MKIKTFYCTDVYQDLGMMKFPVEIINKQIMPNYSETDNHVTEMFKVKRKTGYGVRWLDKHDPEYHKDLNCLITIDGEGLKTGFTAYLKLGWWQTVKMKTIWRVYWILRDDNFKDYILPFLTLIIGFLLGRIACPSC